MTVPRSVEAERGDQKLKLSNPGTPMAVDILTKHLSLPELLQVPLYSVSSRNRQK